MTLSMVYNEMIPEMYGYGSIMPSGATLKTRQVSGSDTPESNWKINSEELKSKGNFLEELYFYDKAIAISPGDGRLHCNRAAVVNGSKSNTGSIERM